MRLLFKMKHSFLLFLLFSASAFAQTPTPTPLPKAASVENVAAIQLIDANGVWSQPNTLSNLWQNIALRPGLGNMLRAKLAWYGPLEGKEYLTAIIAQGVTLPQTAIDAFNARIETLRQQKETALMTVKETNPQRAETKMQSLLSRGLPITQATQDAVNAAAGVSPTPAPTATPTPTPEPNDGL